MPTLNAPDHDRHSAVRLARVALSAFLFTFLAARIIVLLIMSRRIPDLYLHVGGTHVHHLNYGIFLLAAVGGYLLFAGPLGRPLRTAAFAYGVGLGLTFDEFGMWIHLGGSYWQRASYDAVVTVAGLLGLIAVAPAFRHFRWKHWAWAAAILATSALFAALAVERLQKFGPALRQIENKSPV